MSFRSTPAAFFGASIVSLTGLPFGATLAAEEAATQAQTAPAEAPALEEIVVTAQKRTERLLDVPMTVDALSGEQLSKLAIYNFQDIAQLSPGLIISNGSSANQTIQVRGISFQQYSGAAAGVTVYQNEVEVSPTTAVRPLFDIEQIEVLRGAQGTLRGDTSPAGQITLTTRKPDLNTFTADAQQTFGNLSTRNTQAALSLPIIKDMLGLRIAGLYDANDLDGVTNITNGREDHTMEQAWRGTLEFRPIESFDNVFIYQHEQGHTVNYAGANGALGFAAGPGDAASYPLTPSGPPLSPSDLKAVTPGPMDHEHVLNSFVLNSHADFAGQRLTYIGSYWNVNDPSLTSSDTNNAIPNPPASAFDPLYPGLGQYQTETRQRQVTHELRIESADKQQFWQYMFGAYYSRLAVNVNLYQGTDSADTTSMPGAVLDRPGAADINVIIPELIKTKALFTDQRFQITPQDTIEIGARYSRYPEERQSTVNVGITPAGAGVPPAFLSFVCPFIPGTTYGNGLCNFPPNPTIPAAAAKVTFSGWSGSSSYSHHFTPDTMAYFTYGRSYRAGGPDVGLSATLPVNFVTFQPETSNSYELGFKTNLLDDRLQLIGDVFYQKFQDFIGTVQATAYTQTPNASGSPVCNSGTGSQCTAGFTTNGPADSRGFELTARTKFMDSLYTQFNLSYADAHYDNATLYCNDYTNSGVPNASGVTAVQPNKYISTCSTSQPLSPTVGRWQASANGEYSHGLSGKLEGYLRGLVTYSSSAPGLPGNGLSIPAITLVNGFLGARTSGSDHFLDGFLYVRNLFDSHYYRVSSNVPDSNGINPGYQNGQGVFGVQQRSYGATVSFHY
jgi:iron complex outermembrane receptor protein